MSWRRLGLATPLLIAAVLPACWQKVYWDALEQCLPPDPPPFFLWIGAAADAPSSCDEHNPIKLFDAYAGLIPGAFSCPECSCGESNTTCKPPLDWTVVARACDELPGGEEVLFSGPQNWNGTCSTQTTIAANLECQGGEPCAQSMLVGPPELLAAPCEPSAAGDPITEDPPWSWETVAIGCTDDPDVEQVGSCDNGMTYVHGPAQGYRVCVERAALLPCPVGFTEEFTVYFDTQDDRACTPCTCGEPQGSACSFQITAHSDDACATEAGAAFVSSTDESVCFDLPDGTALGSKKADLAFTAPGTCTPHDSTPTGELFPTSPVAFCCQPERQ